MKQSNADTHIGGRRTVHAMRIIFACLLVAAAAVYATPLQSAPPAQSKRTQIFPEFSVEHPNDWSIRQFANLKQILSAPAADIDSGQVLIEDIANVVVHTEQRADRAEALLRLKQIEAESDTPSRFVQIGGWPALQRQQEVHRPQAGKPGVPYPKRTTQMVLTSAIAIDSLIVRFEAVLPPDATTAAIGEVKALAQSIVTRTLGDPTAAQLEVDRLQREPVMRTLDWSSQPQGGLVPLDAPPPQPESVQIAGAPVRVTRQSGIDAELEMTVSTDGRYIVIGSNGNYFVSNDGGQSFAISGGINGNDPSLGYGASGSFYAGNIGGACNTAILISADNGQNFTPVTPAYTCPNAIPTPGPNGCVQDMQCGAGFPDQEHIGVDRYNPAAGGDQIYSAWRSLWSNVGVGIVCSQDSGNNWTPAIFTLGDFPRITVGQNGRVYVVYRRQNNIELWRLSSCATGLVPSAPVAVVTGNPQVPCPVPGLNRCNDGNNLSSPTVAVDDSDANHVFVSYAVNTAANNENVILQDSLNGGASWGSCRTSCGFPLPGDSLFPCTPGGAACPVGGEVCCPNAVQVSSGILGRRFMPWACSVGGEAYVSWFDRRNANAADNSLTDYFAGNAQRDGFSLNVGDEIQYTSVSDSHCGPQSTNWAGTSPRSNNDSESCTQQPQFAGQCATGTCMQACGTPMAGDSNQACNPGGAGCPGGEQCCVTTTAQRCDFTDCGTTGCGNTQTGVASCQCPMNQFCVCGGGNPPRYGDYNGNACMAGRLFSTWVSATSPPSITPPSTSIDIFFSSKIVCCVPQIQVGGPVVFDQACSQAQQTEELEVCNTGKEDLVVDAINSDTAEFSVTDPVAGWPVVISPDFCFPFQVVFTPTDLGAVSGVLTIMNNDQTNPAFDVAVSGNLGDPDIATIIADSGDFGDVCVGDFKDLDLTISNNGTCPLEIDSISSDSTEFDVAGVMSYPILVAEGNSIAVPMRYEPDDFGPSSATITVMTNDPVNGSKTVSLSGNTPPGDIRVSGSTDFGDVCAGDQAEKEVNVCNVGGCNLDVTSATIDCADFTIINNPFPAIVSPDFCMPLTIRFTPTSAGPKTCTLTIISDDPDDNPVTLTLMGNTPLPMIDVPPDQTFPPEVLQDVDACTTPLPFPVSNIGLCPLEITDFAVSSNPAEFSLSGLPSFPIILDPGHIAGDGDLDTVFGPLALDRDALGIVSVTYVSEPILGTMTTVDRDMCGEGVRTGARVLVRHGGVPLAEVKSIKLHRINANRNNDRLDTVDQAMKLPLQMITPATPCAPIMFHREYSTIDNPIQLLPGSYQVTVQARIGGKNRKKSVGFDVSSCDFNPTVVVDF